MQQARLGSILCAQFGICWTALCGETHHSLVLPVRPKYNAIRE